VVVGVEEKVPVIDRASLAVGARVKGPALIEETDTSFYVPPKAALIVDRYKNLIIETGIVAGDRHGEA
jgi:N-methylhydantoinase A